MLVLSIRMVHNSRSPSLSNESSSKKDTIYQQAGINKVTAKRQKKWKNKKMQWDAVKKR